MKILTLDLGTQTGYAIGGVPCDPSRVLAGTKTLAKPSLLRADKATRGDRRLDCRVSNLFSWLNEMIGGWGPDVIVFEDVRFAISQAQAHLWGSLRGAVWCACSMNPRIRVDCIDTGKLKKFATGSGAADKLAMGKALTKKEPYEFIEHANGIFQVASGQLLDDNAIDAIHLLRWAQSIYEKP